MVSPVAVVVDSAADDLRAALRSIDGRPYPAYRDIENVEYDFGRFSLVVQHVQSDPFASRSFETEGVSPRPV